ncbi:TetR family transcriptional regulator C-terminal domain-containing protein [Deinococcus humi]|uniref:TetR/AcrR family transcriptional repressor of bet genes n=1 Tax=Deinococcus humi TaxID=662880 RepID=A0A7W8JRL2_9DEIO|nr:TetR family transcriptional regulator C-terminal domain-containing protein [Deinococcus humi]MBB5361912.1 TetR/AcrR family transcriptional repressor of bet genes [Deinococcus humi]GGO23026.1 TetR family transcriptional regulator [Deinococcus humi]
MARTVNPIQDRARRSALEQAAYLALYERGYAGVTLANIAEHAGVSRGTLVYHFGSRAGLLSAVMRRFTRTITVATRRALRLADTPDAKLRAFVENQFYGVQNTRRFYTVSLDFLAAATRDPALMAVQRDFLRQTLELDLELARLAGEDGAQTRARQLRALVEGLSVRFLADATPDLDAYRADCLSGLRAILGWD